MGLLLSMKYPFTIYTLFCKVRVENKAKVKVKEAKMLGIQNYPKQLNEILKKKTHDCSPIQTKFFTKSKLFYIKNSNTFLLSHLASLVIFFFSSLFV